MNTPGRHYGYWLSLGSLLLAGCSRGDLEAKLETANKELMAAKEQAIKAEADKRVSELTSDDCKQKQAAVQAELVTSSQENDRLKEEVKRAKDESLKALEFANQTTKDVTEKLEATAEQLKRARSEAASKGTGDERILTSLTSEDIKSILQSEGYVITKVDSDGDIYFKVDGELVVWFYTRPNKTITQLYIAWSGKKVDLETINKWNREKILGRAIIDGDGDLAYTLDVDLDKGVTLARVKNTLTTFRTLLKGLKTEMWR